MLKVKSLYIVLFSVLVTGISCKKELLKMNENPNGADPESSNPNLVLSTVLTESGRAFVDLGYQDLAGVMQHTQKDGWAGGHNGYDWGGSNNWNRYYDILRNNKFVHEKSEAEGNTLHQGITLVMKSLIFGLITDLWGDAPYTHALKGDQPGLENKFPVYDAQESIYQGILSDLQQANTLLADNATGSVGNADVYFNGNAEKWRKFANSLSLRYYMRLAEKTPSVAKEGIERIVANPAQYPIILSGADDVIMSFPGNNNGNSWPSNAAYDNDSTNFRRIKLADTFVKALQELNDPRIGVFGEKVKAFLLVDSDFPNGTDRFADTIVNGESRMVRYLSPDVLAAQGFSVADVNQDVDYVGLPLGLSTPYTYNFNFNTASIGGTTTQSARNPHVSWLNKSFASPNDHVVRLLTSSEVHFILAEAGAVYGWSTGDPETHYNQGIAASFDSWGIGSAAAAYIAQPEVTFDGTQEQILTQKWIASWTMAAESWFDWRRTGYPQLQGASTQNVLPVRFYYPLEERNLNTTNVNAAIQRLESAPYDDPFLNNGKNGIWSKPWIIQETGKPW